jgi:hypothetical protein
LTYKNMAVKIWVAARVRMCTIKMNIKRNIIPTMNTNIKRVKVKGSMKDITMLNIKMVNSLMTQTTKVTTIHTITKIKQTRICRSITMKN